MKKTSLFLALIIVATNAYSQDLRKDVHIDYPIPRFSIEAIGLTGNLSSNITTRENNGNYEQPAVYHPGTVKSGDWKMKGGGALEFAYFLGIKHHFGVGLGLMCYNTACTLTLDSFRVEYKEKDSHNYDFRQLVTIKNVKEAVSLTHISIPVTIKYKVNFSKRITISADAGIVVNLVESGKYNTDATGDFEAIYKFNSNGTVSYDSAPTPDNHDWQITRAVYSVTHSGGQVDKYFDSLRVHGYDVGLGVEAKKQPGRRNYGAGSIGFIIRPAIAYNFSKNLAVTMGGYYMSQTVKNKQNDNYRIMDVDGNYNTLLQQVATFKTSSFGVNLGVRYSFGW